MMSLVSRSPLLAGRRPLLILCLCGLAFLVGILVVKDLNEKLSVMTASNAGYQKMTDRQNDNIGRLQQRLKDEQRQRAEEADKSKRKEAEAKAETDKLDVKARQSESELAKARSRLDALSKKMDSAALEQAETNHRLSRAETEATKWQAEARRLTERANKCEEEKAGLAKQYAALFKEHTQAVDAAQFLNEEKERLELQLKDAERNAAAAVMSSSKSPMQQIQPSRSNLTDHRARSSTPRSAHRQQANIIAEPFHPPAAAAVRGLPVASSTKSSDAGAARVAPVAAEPPHVVHQHVQAHQVNREDVMEAPRMDNTFLHHGNNFGDYLHHVPRQQKSVMVHNPDFQQQQHPLDRPQNHQPNVYIKSNGGGGVKQASAYSVQHEEPVYARRKHVVVDHGGHHQQQHHFVRPDSVRFQRREVDGKSSKVTNSLSGTRTKDTNSLTAPETIDETYNEEDGESDDDDGEDVDETADGHVPVLGQGPMILRHIDHGPNEDTDDDLQFEHANGQFSAGGVGADDVINPADFGIHHVNMERNHLRRFQGAGGSGSGFGGGGGGGFQYHQLQAPEPPRVF